MKKNVIIVLVVVCLLGFYTYKYRLSFNVPVDNQSAKPTTSLISPNKASMTSVKDTDTVSVILGVLDALDNYNFAISDTSTSEDITAWLIQLMNSKKRMQQGDVFIRPYLQNADEYISTTASGMIIGSKMVQDSTDNLIQYFRKIDENDPSSYSDLKYQVAKYLSDNKEGFMLIAQSAPQVTSLLWQPATSKNPSGPIPYTVSKSDRQKILDTINDKFETDLKLFKSSTDNFNSIIFAVNAIKNNVEPDTYEQSN